MTEDRVDLWRPWLSLTSLIGSILGDDQDNTNIEQLESYDK